MIDREQLPELNNFEKIEASLPIKENSAFGNLVVPNGNNAKAGHRWFKYKEAFSSELLKAVLDLIKVNLSDYNTFKLLDPYCGVGTSLLSATLLDTKVTAIGIECNPFSSFIATTKLSWPNIEPAKLREHAKILLASKGDDVFELPSLSSISAGRCISAHMSQNIMRMRNAIEDLEASPEREALKLGLAATIEPVSKIRRDGRALRIVEKPPVRFRSILTEQWENIANDIEYLKNCHPLPGESSVIYGDGRDPIGAGVDVDSIDLVFTSPPYPNNIDYNEVYKLELWFLGFVSDSEKFLSLRKSTFRSHPACSTIDGEAADLGDEFKFLLGDGALQTLLKPVLKRAETLENEQKRGRSKVLLGYIYDTWRSLEAHFRALRSGGRAVYTVGNSLHGNSEMPYLIPTDLIIAELGKQIGFQVDNVVVARGLKRRLAGNHFLRDSIVILRKP